MKSAFARVCLVLALVSPLAAHAQSSDPPRVVRGWFAALQRKDFGRALELTTGGALERTAHMVGTLEQQARAHHAEVELRVKRLDVAEAPSGCVQVAFDIDVIGKKWMFRRVAKTLSGIARFHVDDYDRIVAIDGNIE
jgi:hypothetical protein